MRSNVLIRYVYMLILLLLMLAIGIAMTEFGVLLNIKYPKLHFQSEIEAVKGSTSASLAVYIPIAIAFIAGIIYMIIQTMVSFQSYLLILTSVFSVIAIMLYICLKTYGVKKFRELYC
jgi:hypothetical protein